MAQVLAGSKDEMNCAWMAEAVTSAMRAPAPSEEILKGCAAVGANLGFDGFSYLLLRQGTIGPQLLQHWTTAGSRWTARYAMRSYHLIDPRVTRTLGRSIPIFWNDVTDRTDPHAQAFLSDASRHSICGGVAMSLHDGQGQRAVVAWDLRARSSASSREGKIRSVLGTLALVAGLIHEAMTRDACHAEAQEHANELTRRERECLALAARGMTSADIALKLAITKRTVNFHIGNILPKLGALNRGEAIARGVALNLVSMAR